MIRAHKTSFRASSKDLDRLYECNRESARIWNRCLELAKEHHKETAVWINKTQLQKALKGQFRLHSQSVQSVSHRYLWARDSAYQARRKGESTRYPYRSKKYYPTRWVQDGFTILDNGKILLSMGIWKGKRQKPIVVHVKGLPSTIDIKQIELIYDGKLKLGIMYENGTEEPEQVQGQLAAIDMGEIHGVAATTESGDAVVITSRKLRSVQRLRNKKYTELNKKLSRCTPGSRRWKKLTRAKKRIGQKANNQKQDILHKTSRTFVNWAEEHNVSQVYVGDVEGVQRNTSGKKKSTSKRKRRSAKHNQRMSQWSFGLLQTYLLYKLLEKGIVLTKVDEAYTSQTCPVCNRRKKTSGRIYRCKCGYELHRDVHGARNILSKSKYGEILLGEIVTPEHITYLRPAI